MTIYFYSPRQQPYGCFSNFSQHPFELDGLRWPTSEHYFQAQKFEGTPYAEQIRQAPTPKQAANLGRSRFHPLRPDWNDVKDDVMRRAVLAKFRAHYPILAVLLSTEDEQIIEKSAKDYYWGCGREGTGQNRLGQILMEVRETVREEVMNPTRNKVLSKVRQLFPQHDPDEILAILDRYGVDPYENSPELVHLAILKLSEGNLDRLREHVETARRDFLDVRYPAEYPNFWEIGFVGVDKLDDEGVRQLKEADWKQYLAWLHGSQQSGSVT